MEKMGGKILCEKKFSLENDSKLGRKYCVCGITTEDKLSNN